ncbi:hypothetical protein Taro_038594 [Colocasia esculenta]|uniref:Uncharacterized protein n=1 Tax=Colocasia esculenta TaxID=4460 RepID=A0A843WGA7_COLES|nr:hypothetical protein [Colocasia esculenta]
MVILSMGLEAIAPLPLAKFKFSTVGGLSFFVEENEFLWDGKFFVVQSPSTHFEEVVLQSSPPFELLPRNVLVKGHCRKGMRRDIFLQFINQLLELL